MLAEANKGLAEGFRKQCTIYFLTAGAAVGVFGAVFAFLRHGFCGALLMLTAVGGPHVLHFEPRFLVFTGSLGLGCLFALFVRPARAKPAPSETEDEHEDED